MRHLLNKYRLKSRPISRPRSRPRPRPNLRKSIKKNYKKRPKIDDIIYCPIHKKKVRVKNILKDGGSLELSCNCQDRRWNYAPWNKNRGVIPTYPRVLY